MSSKSYSEKLQDPRWQKKRLEIMQRDGFTCVWCGAKKSTLHIHHTKYTKEPWDIDNDSLSTVCKYCHSLLEIYKNIPSVKLLSVISTRWEESEYTLLLTLNINSDIDELAYPTFYVFNKDAEYIDGFSLDPSIIYEINNNLREHNKDKSITNG